VSPGLCRATLLPLLWRIQEILGLQASAAAESRGPRHPVAADFL